MRHLLLCASLIAALCAAQDNIITIQPRMPQPPAPGSEQDVKLPNGKSQREAIVKADYEKSLKDAERLVELSQTLEDDMKKETSQVLSLGDLKKLDEIEKITKRIRGRIRRF